MPHQPAPEPLPLGRSQGTLMTDDEDCACICHVKMDASRKAGFAGCHHCHTPNSLFYHRLMTDEETDGLGTKASLFFDGMRNDSILQDRLKIEQKRTRHWQLITAGIAIVNIIILYKVFL